MSQDAETVIAGCLTRLDSLLGSIGRLQRAHALRVRDPRGERSFNEIRLAKAAIETDYQILKIKLTQVRDTLGNDEQQARAARRRSLAAKVFSR